MALQKQRMMSRLATLSKLATGAIALAAGAQAAEHPQRSHFTTVDLTACTPVRGAAAGTAWQCKGLPGVPVHVAMAQRRTYLSAGARPEIRRAARQSLKAVNTAVDARSGHITIEWRLVRRGGQPKPYAMIVRYTTTSEQAKGEVLVVSRVGDSETCHAAYVDALANPDAIVLARSVADGEARTFDCATPPKVIGVTGKSPM